MPLVKVFFVPVGEVRLHQTNLSLYTKSARDDLFLLQFSINLTVPCTILEPSLNPSIDEFNAVRKRRSTDLEARIL